MILSDISTYVTDKVSNAILTPRTYVGVDNMQPNYGTVADSEYVPTEGYATQFKVGDILIGNIRPYFKKIWIADRDGGCSNDVLVIRPNESVNSTYLYVCLANDAFFDYDLKGAKGSKMPRGDKDHIMRFPVSICNNYETAGEMIANINAKITLNNAICTDLEAMAKQIYDYWFVQFDFPDKNGKPYKSSGGKMVWNEELNREIPEGWNKGNLYDVADFINGLACQKFRPIDDNHKLPVVKITEMHDGITDKTEWVRDDIDDSHIIDDSTILFSWSASLEIMLWNGGKAGLNQHIFKVEPKVDSKTYVYFQLSDYVINFIKMAEARKTTMGHITSDHLAQSKIIVPDNNVLKAFEEVVSSIMKQISNIKSENRQLTELRDFLLPMLMNGQIKIGA